jgi:hypothetical protein
MLLQVDMLVGDIYGGRDYSSIGLSATTIASSFGKVVGQDKELGDYNPAGEVCRLHVCMSVCLCDLIVDEMPSSVMAAVVHAALARWWRRATTTRQVGLAFVLGLSVSAGEIELLDSQMRCLVH